LEFVDALMSKAIKRTNDSNTAEICKKKNRIEEEIVLNSLSYSDLPNEILFKIFGFLNIKDLCKIARCLKNEF
jgi:hypothetical protein